MQRRHRRRCCLAASPQSNPALCSKHFAENVSGTLNELRLLLLRLGAASGNLCSSNQTVQHQQQQQQIPLINGLRALIPPHAFRFNAPTPAEAGLALLCFGLVDVPWNAVPPVLDMLQ